MIACLCTDRPTVAIIKLGNLIHQRRKGKILKQVIYATSLQQPDRG